MSDGPSQGDPGSFSPAQGKAGGSKGDRNRVRADRASGNDSDAFTWYEAKFAQSRTDRIGSCALFNPVNDGVIPLGEGIQIPHQFLYPSVYQNTSKKSLTAS